MEQTHLSLARVAKRAESNYYQSMIIANNEEALRVKCEDASTDEVGSIIQQLENELEYSEKLGRKGIGLAAPQCAIKKNVAIVRISNTYKVDLVNCKIKNAYDKTMFRNEGCLSFPNRIEDTMRYQEVHITDNLVFPYSFIATGLLAVVIQHELDHLNGILLPDLALPKIEKAKKLKPNDICYCGSNVKYKRCHGA